jgi:hypothetical protein
MTLEWTRQRMTDFLALPENVQLAMAFFNLTQFWFSEVGSYPRIVNARIINKTLICTYRTLNDRDEEHSYELLWEEPNAIDN